MILGVTGVIWTLIDLSKVTSELGDAHAIRDAGELIIGHLEESQEMPRSWDDLVPIWIQQFGADTLTGEGRSLVSLRETVHIPFERLEELRWAAERGGEIPTVITAVSGSNVRWEGWDADEMIAAYLRTKQR